MDATPTDGGRAGLVPRVIVRFAIGVGLYAAALFLSAGTFAWARAWVYLAVVASALAIQLALLVRVNPELLRARMERHEGTKPFDRALVALYTFLTIGILVVAGLDLRNGGPPFPLWTLFPGMLLHLAGQVPIVWAMAVNEHLEVTVRIQTDRAHRVVSDGPYRVVRHPTYAGIIVLAAGAPLILGSLWCYAVWGAIVATLVARTAFEDRTVRRELPGYEEYARKTRHRLVPGLW
jgi:protein-S-isoprenylcysteine O-methyltransferase Ste14